MSPSLDINDKYTTSFAFSKIDSINVKNNIDKKRNASTCITEFCKYMMINKYDKESWNKLPISVNDSIIFTN